MKVLSIVCYCATVIAVITVPFLVADILRVIRARPINRLGVSQFHFSRTMGLFVISCLIVIIISTSVSIYVRNDVLKFVNGLSGNYTVYVNQQQIHEPDKMISALKEVAPYWGHHSHPTKRIHVLIRSDVRDLRLDLARDSANPQEYWVFYLDQDLISENEIGRITTSVFNEY